MEPLQPKLIILKGLPGSGKSTWALEFVKQHKGTAKRVNKDELRAMLDAGRHTRGNENFVLRVRDFIVIEALRLGKTVVVDDTNFEPRHVERLREIAIQFGKETGQTVEIEEVLIDIMLPKIRQMNK